MDTIESRKSDVGFNIWHAMTHSYRAPGSPKYAIGFGAFAVLMMIVAYTAIILVFALLMGASVAHLSAGDISGVSGGAVAALVLAYILFLLFMIYLAAVLEAGMHRRMLGLQDSGFPFRLGQDETNVFVSLLGVYGLYLGAVFIGGLFGGLLGAISPILNLALVIIYVFVAVFMVKLSPAAALTVLNKKPQVLAALKVSKYRSGSIFFTYVCIVTFFYGSLCLIVLLVMGPLIFSGGMGGDPTAALKGGSFGLIVVASLAALALYVMTLPMMMGVGSYVVNHWRGEQED